MYVCMYRRVNDAIAKIACSFIDRRLGRKEELAGKYLPDFQGSDVGGSI